MRSLLALALVATTAPALSAQSIFDSEFRLAPQFMQYQIKAPTNQTISELSIPVFVSMPFGPSFTLDVGTAFARATASSTGTSSSTSTVSGLTDTQVRGNYTLGNDFIVLTGGVNLPTGQSSVTSDQLNAAGLIANDYLAFPIASLGTGLAATAGLAMARPLGEWNIGFGASARHSTSYDPFNIPGQSIHFAPGDEYRARVGVDRPYGTGSLAIGLTYSAFGDDQAGTSVYNTGNRLIAQASLNNAIAGKDVTFAAYNIFRASGTYASGAQAGRENIANLYAGIGLPGMGTVWVPSIEVRQWMQDIPQTSGAASSQTSMLATVGLRTHVDVAGLSVFPSAGYTMGNLATVDGNNVPTKADLTGFRAQLAIRMSP